MDINVNFRITGKTGIKPKATWKERHWFKYRADKPQGIRIDVTKVKGTHSLEVFQANHGNEFI